MADGANRYTYDTLGRLVQVSNAAGSTRYLFDPLGQRVAKLSGSGKEGEDDSGDKRDGKRDGKGGDKEEDSKTATTYFTYDTAGHLIGEYNRQRSQSTEYVWLGNAPVAVLNKNGTAPANLYYVHTDHLGTPRQVTDSATNAVVWEWFGEPFGTSVPDEDPGHTRKKFTLNLRYAGQYYDKESSLFHNGFRDYNPKIGRYVQSDPIGLKGGINTYNYVNGNPISYTDPKGLNPGMGGGTDSCDHYAQRCAQSGGTSYYYCQMAQSVCNMPVPTKWWRCVRKCLQDYDKACSRCSDGSPNKQCTTEAHAHCWTECSE